MRNGIIALALIFSLMLSIASVPVVSSAADEDPCTGGTCVADYDVTLTELEGAEKEKAIADALKDGEVKKLFLELVKTEYTPRIDDAMAFTEEDSGIMGVVIPFEQKDTGEPAEIVWIYNPETGATIVVLTGYSWWQCILCSVGCGLACPALLIACAVYGGIFTYGALTITCGTALAIGACDVLCHAACREWCE